MRTRAATLGAAVAVLLSATVLGGCSSDDGKVKATATFEDVADLADGAPVMMADIAVGSVTGIHLDRSGRRAKVDFQVDEDAEVPADIVAKVRRTTPLGEKFIDLEPQTTDPDAALLRSGTVVKRTEVVSDLEQLVSSGAAAFGALSASQLAILIDEGARAFGGEGPQLRQVLDNVSTIVEGYSTHTGEISSIIDDLGQLSGDLAPNVGPNAEALANMNETLGVLNENDQRFFALVRSLNDLADDGNRTLTKYLGQIRTQVKGLRDVADAVADEQVALGDVLTYAPEHNEGLPSGVRNKFVQALLDVVVCGFPGGGDVPGDPVDACYPGGGGGER